MMKTRKIDGVYYSVIEKKNQVFLGVGLTYKQSVCKCLMNFKNGSDIDSTY